MSLYYPQIVYFQPIPTLTNYHQLSPTLASYSAHPQCDCDCAEFVANVQTNCANYSGKWYALVDDFRTLPFSQMVGQIPRLDQVSLA